MNRLKDIIGMGLFIIILLLIFYVMVFIFGGTLLGILGLKYDDFGSLTIVL